MVSSVVYVAGFHYNTDEDIYSTRHYALQRLFGFNNLYDKMAAPVGMVIDVEPVRFDLDNKDYMVELWKGQYYSSVGAEIGFYVGTKLNVMGDPHYRCARTHEELDITFTLEKRGKKVFRVEGRHWWLTGFKPGVFGDPRDLKLTNIQIRFDSEDMAEAFEFALADLGYTKAEDDLWRDDDVVGFIFSTPKTEQPWSSNQTAVVLWYNKGLVATLKALKGAFDMDDFGPESIAGAIDDSLWYGLTLFRKLRLIF